MPITRTVILQPAKKLGMILLLLVQLFRLAGVAVVLYFIVVSLIIDGEALPMFDQNPTGDTGLSTGDTGLSTGDMGFSTDDTGLSTGDMGFSTGDMGLSTGEEIPAETPQERGKRVRDWIGITIPAMEVAISLLVTHLIMGPLSREISVGQWIKWLLKLRMFWMRLTWAAAGCVYADFLLKLRYLKFKDSLDVKYNDGAMVKIGLALTAVEYTCLGMVESVMKVIKVETIERRLQNHDKGIIGSWKKLCMVIYYLATLAYALRNFTMSLYFGILSAVASNGLAITPPTAVFEVLKGVVLVLQIYLAIARGKFYSFFMRNLLSNFLWEVDEEKLQGDLEGRLSRGMGDKKLERETTSLVAQNDNVPKDEVV